VLVPCKLFSKHEYNVVYLEVPGSNFCLNYTNRCILYDEELLDHLAHASNIGENARDDSYYVEYELRCPYRSWQTAVPAGPVFSRRFSELHHAAPSFVQEAPNPNPRLVPRTHVLACANYYSLLHRLHPRPAGHTSLHLRLTLISVGVS
jgi:hypothetical protein